MISGPWWLLRDDLGDPAWNMAVDEVLLERASRNDEERPCLRLYGWSPAAISLGRFQRWQDVAVPAGAGLVRRASGGAALYHRSDEITYAVAGRYGPGQGPRAAYDAIHAVLAAALSALIEGPVANRGCGQCLDPVRPRGLCYVQPSAYDLLAEGRKLVGSAQRRQGKAFVQHGALPFSADPLLGTESTSLEEVLGRVPERAAVEQALLEAFAAAGAELEPRPLSAAERARAEELVAEKYGSEAWTRSR